MKVIVLRRFMYKKKARIEGDIVDIDDQKEAQALIKCEYAKAETAVTKAKKED